MDFHGLMRQYMKRCPNISYASEACGINRTTLQHYLSGKRIPENEEKVENLAKAMLLSPEEKKSFFDAYHIALVGEDVYMRRENISRILTHLRKENNPEEAQEELTGISYSMLPDTYEATDKKGLVLITSNLLDAAACEGGELYLFLQPDFTEFFTILSLVSERSKKLKIRHIFSVKKMAGTRDEKQNLECLSMVLNISAYFRNYEPYYYYDYRSDEKTCLSPAPYCVFYRDSFLLISSNYETGFFSKNEAQSRFYKSVFSRLKNDCYPAMHRMQDAVSATEYLNRVFLDKKPLFGIEYDFCIAPFLRQDVIHRYLNISAFTSDSVLPCILDYMEKYRRYLESETGFIDAIASLSGFAEFMKTGFPDEIPKTFMKAAIEPEIRVKILRDMLKAIRAGNYKIRFMKKKEVISKGWSVTSFKNYLMICHNDDFSASFFNDTGLVSAFYDYQLFLRADPLLMTDEESVAFIEEQIFLCKKNSGIFS